MTNPYASAARAYFKKGWENPIPIGNAPRQKTPVPKGVTGQKGGKVGYGQMEEWIAGKGHLNIGIRLQSMMAFDVDGPEGAACLAEMATEVGVPLPPTYTSTSRGPDSERRHHFYRVPYTVDLGRLEGVLRKKYGEKLDILHRGHRYAIVAPSVHPDGGTYMWYTPAGAAMDDKPRIPETKDVPELPEEWVSFLVGMLETPAAAAVEDDEGFFDTPNSLMTRAQVDKAWERMVARFTEGYQEGNRNNAIRDLAFEAYHYSGVYFNTLADVTELVRKLGEERFGFARLDHEDVGTIERAWADARDQGQWVAELAPDAPASITAAAGQEPADPREPEDRFTDAQMAGRLAREVLAGRYIYTKALGWRGWNGNRWAGAEEEQLHEVVRKWTLAGYLTALKQYSQGVKSGRITHPVDEDPHVVGWTRMQGLGRIQSVSRLARGIVLRNAADFDTATDLLNTPGGVVNLRTGEVMPHDPARLITKITKVAYVPGAESPALKSALLALPDDVPDWLQLRLGEATTGNTSEQMVLLTGTGRNGKTLLMGAIFRALGGYAAKVPNTLLMRNRNPGAATPEKMTLRGIRLAYMEETPEDGYLDATVVKDLLDAQELDGRFLYKDIVTWQPTHSIFLNTNHPPTMADTGDGAWRRMARVDFPYHYCRAGEPLERESDRHGDPHLKARLSVETAGQEAILAWLVAGAVRYYAAGSLEDAGDAPASVTASVRRWRAESDDLLRFMDDEMVMDPGQWVATADFYGAFVAWQKANGCRPLSSKAFNTRLDSHSGLPKTMARIQRSITVEGLSRPSHMNDGWAKPLPARAKGWSGLGFGGPEQEF